jgi:hypothetical protein
MVQDGQDAKHQFGGTKGWPGMRMSGLFANSTITAPVHFLHGQIDTRYRALRNPVKGEILSQHDPDRLKYRGNPRESDGRSLIGELVLLLLIHPANVLGSTTKQVPCM